MTQKRDKVELLVDYVRGTLSAEEVLQVEEILARDAKFAELLQLVKQMENNRNEYDTTTNTAAEKLSAQLFDDYLQQAKQGKQGRGVVVFDSRLLPLPDGVRPAAVDTRRIKYRLGELTLHISLYPISPESFEMIGQLSGGSERIYTVHLVHAGKPIITETDLFGLFRFERISSGMYELVVFAGKKKVGTVDISL